MGEGVQVQVGFGGMVTRQQVDPAWYSGRAGASSRSDRITVTFSEDELLERDNRSSQVLLTGDSISFGDVVRLCEDVH